MAGRAVAEVTGGSGGDPMGGVGGLGRPGVSAPARPGPRPAVAGRAAPARPLWPPVGARRPPPPSPPPGRAAAGSERGSPACGAMGCGNSTAASAGAGRGERRGMEGGRRDPGRAGVQLLPRPHFRDRSTPPAFGKTESATLPPRGGGRAGTGRACGAILRRGRGEGWRRGSLRRVRWASSPRAGFPAAAASAPFLPHSSPTRA